MLPPNWRFVEIIRNGVPELILENYSKNNYIKQYIFSKIIHYKVGDVLIHKKSKISAIIINIIDDKIILKKNRFEITIDNDDCDDWEKN